MDNGQIISIYLKKTKQKTSTHFSCVCMSVALSFFGAYRWQVFLLFFCLFILSHFLKQISFSRPISLEGIMSLACLHRKIKILNLKKKKNTHRNVHKSYVQSAVNSPRVNTTLTTTTVQKQNIRILSAPQNPSSCPFNHVCLFHHQR